MHEIHLDRNRLSLVFQKPAKAVGNNGRSNRATSLPSLHVEQLEGGCHALYGGNGHVDTKCASNGTPTSSFPFPALLRLLPSTVLPISSSQREIDICCVLIDK